MRATSNKSKRYKGFADIVSLKDNTTKKRIKSVGLLEQGQVRVEDVLALPSHENLNDDLVSSIAESFPLSGGGPFNPIIVRRVRGQEDGQKVIKVVLVAGAHRLKAARLTGIKYINCTYFDGDETAARIVQISEDLFRKDLTVLQRAELLVEWVKLVEAKGFFSGQYVRKGKLGRPRSGFSMYARELPALGRTFEARRKKIERLTKIERISAKAKEAAIAAGLDDNQKALRQIAEASGRRAQVRKVAELAARFQDATEVEKKRSRSQQSTADEKAAANGSAAGIKTNIESPIADTTFETLEALWKREGRKLWQYAPFDVREQFLETLRRTRCKARADVVKFIEEIFRGREKIGARKLYAFAKTRGLAEKVVRKALGELGYGHPKKHSRNEPWYYWNKNPNCKNQLRAISDAEVEAPLEAERKLWNQALHDLPFNPKWDDYNYRN